MVFLERMCSGVQSLVRQAGRGVLTCALGLAVCLCALFASTVMAGTVSQTRELAFGLLPALNGVCEMDGGGNLTGTCFGSGTVGRFRLEGESRQQVTVSVSQGQSSGTGVVFEPILVDPVTSLSNRGRRNVFVRGRLTLNQPSEGLHDLTYTINVFFE